MAMLVKDLQQFLGNFTDKLKGNAISHARIYVEKDGFLEDIARMEVQENRNRSTRSEISFKNSEGKETTPG